MNETRSAVYAGTFDPPTVGHQWMIEQGAALFPRLIVGLGIHPGKSPLFPVAARLAMLRDSVKHLPNAEVEEFSNRYLIDFARERGARFVLRGIRTESDYEYERAMRNINGDLAPGVTTVFLMPPREIAEVSSSLVKSLIGPVGWEEVVQKYVSPAVHAKLVEAARARA